MKYIKIWMLLLCMLQVSIKMYAQIDKDIVPKDVELKAKWEKKILNGYKLSKINSKNGEIQFVILNQGQRKIEILNSSGDVVNSWGIEVRGWHQMVASRRNEIFLGSASPDTGYFFDTNGKLKHSLKLFRTGSFTFHNNRIHISTFAKNFNDNSTIGYCVIDDKGKEYVFKEICTQLKPEHRKYVSMLTNPMIFEDRVVLMDKHFPLIISLNHDGSLLSSVLIEDSRFSKATKRNLLNRGGKYQFTSIDRIGDDVLVSHVGKTGRIELLQISYDGKIKSIYTLKGLIDQEPALCSIVVVKENPLEIAILDSRNDKLRYCQAIEKEIVPPSK